MRRDLGGGGMQNNGFPKALNSWGLTLSTDWDNTGPLYDQCMLPATYFSITQNHLLIFDPYLSKSITLLNPILSAASYITRSSLAYRLDSIFHYLFYGSSAALLMAWTWFSHTLSAYSVLPKLTRVLSVSQRTPFGPCVCDVAHCQQGSSYSFAWNRGGDAG